MMGARNGMNTKNSAPQQSILPDISPKVVAQLHEVFADIDYLDGNNVSVQHLLTMIGDEIRGLSGDNLLSDLNLRYLRNNVKVVKEQYKYSTSRRPWCLVVYHAGFIFLWILLVIPRLHWIINALGRGQMALIAVVSAVSGAIGASVFAISGLYTHRIRMDLDGRFAMWYLVKPLVGAIMGGFVGLLASIAVHGVGGVSVSPFTIVAAGLGGMHEAWAMNKLQNYTNKAFGQNKQPATTSSTLH